MPSRTFSTASADGSRPNHTHHWRFGKNKGQTSGAPFEVAASQALVLTASGWSIQRSATAQLLLRPNRAGIGRAAIDRLDPHAVIGLADCASNGAPFARHRPACASLHTSPTGTAASRKSSVVVVIRSIVPLKPSLLSSKLPRSDRQAKQLFWALFVQSRSGSRKNTFGRKLRQHGFHAAFRDKTLGHNFGERHQHEGAFEQAMVRQRQFRFVDPDVIVGDEVEIEVRPCRSRRARSRPNSFDLCSEQQRADRDCFDFDGGVDERPASPLQGGVA